MPFINNKNDANNWINFSSNTISSPWNRTGSLFSINNIVSPYDSRKAFFGTYGISSSEVKIVLCGTGNMCSFLKNPSSSFPAQNTTSFSTTEIAYVDSSGNWNSLSDRRLKEKIEKINDA